jgi:predicted LPLAT superfamily acyltransferase
MSATATTTTAAPGRHWASIGESTFVGGIVFLLAVHRFLGRLPFLACLYPVVAWYWLTRPLARRSSNEYLARLHARHGVFARAPGAREGLRHFIRFGETLLDKFLAINGRFRYEKIDIAGYEGMLAASRAGQGAVLVTAHIGCLELMQAAANRREGLRVNVLVHTAHAERFNRLLDRLNPGSKVRLLQVRDFSAATVMMLADRVAQGEFIAIAGDRVPLQGDRVVTADFLGHPAPLPIGPWLMASLLKCPAYVIACVRHGDGYRVRVQQLAERVELPRHAREQALAQYAGRFAAWMESQVQDAPYEWFNFFPFWDQTPHVSATH